MNFCCGLIKLIPFNDARARQNVFLTTFQPEYFDYNCFKNYYLRTTVLLVL